MVSADDRNFPRVLKLRAGQIELEFEPEHMLVRHLRLGHHEFVRGIYAAVRDVEWGTYPVHISELETEIDGDQFVVRWLSATPVLEWLGELRGTPLGEVAYEVRGVALDSFETMRAGICVLHPSKECQGLVCRIEHPDGRAEEEWFPIEVAPHQPFHNIRAMEYSGPGHSKVRIDFQGDVFETEDQRNWSDASFKTYCRPLDSPAPYVLKAGDLVEQTVRVTIEADRQIQPTSYPDYATIELKASKPNDLTLPQIGTMLGVTTQLSAWQVDRLKEMNLAHIGVSADLARKSWPPALASAARLKIPVEVHLRSFDRPGDLRSLLCALKDLEIARILLVSDEMGVSRESLVEEIHATLQTATPVVAASGQNFTELNRSRPRVHGLAGIGFAMNPQMHAFDDLSLMETTEIHGELVQNARRLSKGLPVSVGPVTLEPSHWVDRHADQRLNSPFAAAWVFASLASFSIAGAHSLTYFETHGPRGILSDHQDECKPVEKLLDRILRFRDLTIIESDSDLPLAVRSLLFDCPNGPVAIIANLRETRVEVALFDGKSVLEPLEIRWIEPGRTC